MTSRHVWLLAVLVGSFLFVFGVARNYFQHEFESRITEQIRMIGGCVTVSHDANRQKGSDSVFRRILSIEPHPREIPAGLFEEIGKLSAVRSMNLQESQVTDRDLIAIQTLSSLSFVDLDKTETTAVGRDSLRHALPNCKIIPEP